MGHCASVDRLLTTAVLLVLELHGELAQDSAEVLDGMGLGPVYVRTADFTLLTSNMLDLPSSVVDLILPEFRE